MIVNPWGETMAEVGQNETLLTAELELTAVNKVRSDFPVLRDMRTRIKLERNPAR